MEVSYDELADVPRLYEEKFRKIFGYFPRGRSLELHSLRVRAVGPSTEEEKESFEGSGEEIKASGESNCLSREDIPVGAQVMGPCLVADDFGTLWIEDGWRALKGDRGSLLLESVETEGKKRKEFPEVARRELFANRFFCLAEEMGAQLERTALSVNVRERLDFSCALLDGKGYLAVSYTHLTLPTNREV